MDNQTRPAALDAIPTPPRFNMSFPPAAQPDIIRANQKDMYYRSQLQEGIDYVARESLGTRGFMRYQSEIRTLSDLIYYFLTTVAGSQTLGEEYCDLLQVDVNSRTFPSRTKRALLVLCQVGVPYIVSKVTAHIKQLSQAATLDPSTEDTAALEKPSLRQRLIQFGKTGLPWLERVWKNVLHPGHLAIFYFVGAYYHWSKRITGIRYIFMHQLSPNEESYGYEILGVLIVIQLLVRGIQAWRKRTQQKQQKAIATAATTSRPLDTDTAEDVILIGDTAQPSYDEQEESQSTLMTHTTPAGPGANCALCLDPRRHTTATPCGHMFCWLCICQWCQNKPECPLCRQPAPLSHLMVVHNC